MWWNIGHSQNENNSKINNNKFLSNLVLLLPIGLSTSYNISVDRQWNCHTSLSVNTYVVSSNPTCEWPYKNILTYLIRYCQFSGQLLVVTSVKTYGLLLQSKLPTTIQNLNIKYINGFACTFAMLEYYSSKIFGRYCNSSSKRVIYCSLFNIVVFVLIFIFFATIICLFQGDIIL